MGDESTASNEDTTDRAGTFQGGWIRAVVLLLAFVGFAVAARYLRRESDDSVVGREQLEVTEFDD